MRTGINAHFEGLPEFRISATGGIIISENDDCVAAVVLYFPNDHNARIARAVAAFNAELLREPELSIAAE